MNHWSKFRIISHECSSQGASNTFNQVAEAKRFEGVSYVEKYAEFKNQTLKKIGWYTKMLCATEYLGGRQFLKFALKWGTLYHRIYLTYLTSQEKFCIGAKLFLGTPWMRKQCFWKINTFGQCEIAWLPWQPLMQFLRVGVYIQILHTTNLGTKLKVRHMPFIQWPEMQIS